MDVELPARRSLHKRQTALVLALTGVMSGLIGLPARASAGDAERARVREWPCRLVVHPPLLEAPEAAWRRSATLQRQCRELADAGAVVIPEWGKTDSHFRAVTRWGLASALWWLPTSQCLR